MSLQPPLLHTVPMQERAAIQPCAAFSKASSVALEREGQRVRVTWKLDFNDWQRLCCLIDPRKGFMCLRILRVIHHISGLDSAEVFKDITVTESPGSCMLSFPFNGVVKAVLGSRDVRGRFFPSVRSADFLHLMDSPETVSTVQPAEAASDFEALHKLLNAENGSPPGPSLQTALPEALAPLQVPDDVPAPYEPQDAVRMALHYLEGRFPKVADESEADAFARSRLSSPVEAAALPLPADTGAAIPSGAAVSLPLDRFEGLFANRLLSPSFSFPTSSDPVRHAPTLYPLDARASFALEACVEMSGRVCPGFRLKLFGEPVTPLTNGDFYIKRTLCDAPSTDQLLHLSKEYGITEPVQVFSIEDTERTVFSVQARVTFTGYARSHEARMKVEPFTQPSPEGAFRFSRQIPGGFLFLSGLVLTTSNSV